MIGISLTSSSFGTTIYSDSTAVPNPDWTKRAFSFFAPNSGKFITVRSNGGSFSTGWALVENFVLEKISPINCSSSNSSDVTVFINTQQNQVYVENLDVLSKINKITVITMLGQEIFQITDPGFRPKIDLSIFSSAFFLLKVDTQMAQSVFKIVKP